MVQSLQAVAKQASVRTFAGKCIALLAGLSAVCLLLVPVLAHPYNRLLSLLHLGRIGHPSPIDIGVVLIVAALLMMVIFPAVDYTLVGISAAYRAEKRMLRDKISRYR